MDSAKIRVVEQPAELIIFDLDGRLERACELIVDAGQAGAHWILFPEGYLPGAPLWLWSVPHSDGKASELHAHARASAVAIPSDSIDRLCRITQRSRVCVVMGVVERDGADYYNSLLFIDAHGRICRHDRTMLNTPIWRHIGAIMPLGAEQRHAQQEWTGGM